METEVIIRIQITPQNIVDMMVTAGYGAVDYWALLTQRKGGKWVVVEQETNRRFILTTDQIRDAFAKLVDPTQGYCANYIHQYFINAVRDADENGIDTGHIDATAADVLVQVACFDEIVYG